MKVILLGTGSSVGVPSIGCECKVCKSTNIKNKRSRASIYVNYKNTSLIVDTSPDLRTQALANDIQKIDSIFFTHSHADHINGIDDVRSFNLTSDKPLPAFGNEQTLNYIKQAFPYIFTDNIPGKGWYKPWLLPKYINFYDEFQFGDIKVRTFQQTHGKSFTMGYRFNDMAYTTDANFLDDKAFEILKGVKLWIIDCLRYEFSESHANFEITMEWIKKINPEQAILTHMAHDMDYDELDKKLPKSIRPGYDQMIINM